MNSEGDISVDQMELGDGSGFAASEAGDPDGIGVGSCCLFSYNGGCFIVYFPTEIFWFGSGNGAAAGYVDGTGDDRDTP